VCPGGDPSACPAPCRKGAVSAAVVKAGK
jgi:hypothetical protein